MKRTVCLLICVVSLLLTLAVSASAAPFIDINAECELSVEYSYGGTPVTDAAVEIYRVGNVDEDGYFTLSGSFADYPVDVTKIKSQDEWRTVTTTLMSFVVSDGIEADLSAATDGEGKITFDDLSVGLYMVSPITVVTDELIYEFESFLVSVPGRDANGLPLYEVDAVPKYDTRIPEPDPVEYKVVKQWKDEGSDRRPVSVEIELFKDGVTQGVHTLSAENNWCYTWSAADDGGVWTVVERNEPEGYTVSISKNGAVFVVTNSLVQVPPVPPTGDITVIWPYVLILFALGGILMLFAVRKRKVDDEE